MKTAFAIEFHNSPDESVKQIAKDQYNRNPIMLAYRAEYVVATELSGAGDAMRIGLGLDPYTGEKLGWGQRAAQAGQFLIIKNLGGILKVGNAAFNSKLNQNQVKNLTHTVNYFKTGYDVSQAMNKEFHKE
jgi:hypothetical protein